MSAVQADETDDATGARPAGKPAAKGGKKKLIIAGAAAVVILGGVGGAYAAGLFGKSSSGPQAHASSGPVVPGAVDMPEIISNLNAGPRRSAFIRLKARLELANKDDQPAVLAGLPKVQDLFQTYLRDMRPDELRGSAGTYRLREELTTRANLAVAPAQITEILFVELLVQ
jgi:flagellar FliL protein